MVFDGGATFDGNCPGLTDFTAGLLSSGAGKRNAVDFARDVENLGADIGADAGYDSVVIELDALRRYLPEGIDLLCDLVLRPRFETDEIERDRSQHVAGLRTLRSEPDWLAETVVRRHVMEGTPYAEPVEGREGVIRSLDRPSVVARHEKLLSSQARIIAAGDMEIDELVRMLDERLGTSEIRSKSVPGPPSRAAESAPALLYVDRHGSAHTSLRLARRAVPRRHQERTALRVLTTILGDYFNSRLNNRLREDLGYTYGAWAALDSKKEAGTIWIGTSVAGEQVEETIRTIREEIDRLADEPVSPEELELVARYMAGRHALSRETAESVGGLISTILLYELPRDHYNRTLDEIRALTPEALLEVAQKYFRAEDFTVVAAGEWGRMRDGLKASGSPEEIEEDAII